ncbi:transmembrane protein 51 [Rhineura floridana]|uniref:transmembrane protein 51 n=1 Tax=Rhineura floridana TaxID=261503 RepID=UPI002AC8311E|nr:transmembrane protein 51 [Rhineura floridana]XP_061456962.1 transmembrane protein 51 [Rhineura floridana]XP_061456963.1 transmembrane protein 51 [Rhineura floridana]XP_061456964.1 transmembrane protein 51 [Rhineura floridana]
MARSRSNGSHYALTAIGLGMLVLGIIMAVWNLVPGFGQSVRPHYAGNNSNTEPDGEQMYKSKTFSVAYVLVGAGVLLLLFSVCLSVRDRRRQRENEDISRIRQQASGQQQQQEESQEEEDESFSRYYVPSYEEVMNAEYPGPTDADRNARISMSLPSYESLTGIDETTPTRPVAAAEARPDIGRRPSRHSSRLSKRFKPLKVRRIKSEKLHLKNLQINLPDGSNSGRITIEPLTPPPQYDDIPNKHTESREET